MNISNCAIRRCSRYPSGTLGQHEQNVRITQTKVAPIPTSDVRLNKTRGSAIAEEPRDALGQLKYYGRFLTELLTRSSANTEELCEHTVS